MTKYSILFFCLFYSVITNAQTTGRSIHIKKIHEEIKIDGIDDEAAWKTADVATQFREVTPYDTSEAKTKTEVRLLFDENNIYVFAVCYDDIKKDYVIQSLKRDYSYPASDAFAIVFDPFNDKTNGFNFGVNPMGAQREGLVANGGNFGVSTDWDNLWYSDVKHYEDRWTCEFAIPFKSIRFKEGLTNWGVNFVRNDMKRFESTSWTPIPRTYNISVLNFCGNLIWDDAPPKTKHSISVIPYVSTSLNSDYKKSDKVNFRPGIGTDIKYAVSSSLNLDITINPDFSQVEVDRQQVNLTSYSLFYPERRQFFIENSDLFSSIGFSQIRPFFSRQIGLRNGSPIPILGGARLSGKLNEKWRIGAMNVVTAEDPALKVKSQNYSVLALQRQIFKTSSVQFTIVNRDALQPDANAYNRVVCLDYFLLSPNNRWRGKAFYHQSFSPDLKRGAAANATFLQYSTPKWDINWNHEYVSKDYNAEVGFVPHQSQFDAVTNKFIKQTFYRLEPSITYRRYPKSSRINYHAYTLYWNYYTDMNFKTQSSYLNSAYSILFQNSAILLSNININFVNQLTSLKLSKSIVDIIMPGRYQYNNADISFASNKRRKLNYAVFNNFGNYFNSLRNSTTLDVNYRYQPWGIFNLNYAVNYFRWESGNRSALHLMGAKAELSFTKALYFTAFFQYNTQAENVNLNLRLQWRFKPMSDLFIVYTDNYDPYLGIKNRALVAKLIWWLML